LAAGFRKIDRAELVGPKIKEFTGKKINNNNEKGSIIIHKID